jgi:hypothetical protein
MPLILGTDYAELRDFVGAARLAPASGDPHDGTLVHFALALDPESETLRDLGTTMGGMITSLGANPMSWLGSSMAIYLDEDPFVTELIETGDRDEAFENLQVDANDVPLVVCFDVQSPVRLAAFLGGIRAFAEETTPGILSWEDMEENGQRFVRIGADEAGIGDVSVYYATLSDAWILSLKKEALLQSLERRARRKAGAEAAPAAHWLGESAALEVAGEGLRLFELLFGEDLKDELKRGSWSNLAILNEWKRRFPEVDPLELHERLFSERLTCPGGGEYAWNAEWHTHESSVFGHPGEPRPGVALTPAWSAILRARFGITFEQEGLRAGAELTRE